MRNNQKRKGNPSNICAEVAIAPKSAPILIVFAMLNSETAKYKTGFE